MEIKQEKIQIRKKCEKTIIDNQSKKNYDINITKNVKRLTCYKRANKILIYSSIKCEPNTNEIIKDAFNKKKEVYLPICGKDNNLKFYLVNSLNNLKKGMFSILEPEKAIEFIPFGNPICILPGIAFDRHGNRLGRGMGYYDRFLASFYGDKIGIIYDEFLYDNVPNQTHDIKMDIVITQKRIHKIATPINEINKN